ncbi:MAG: ABC transporter transmembrane domain-containing protein, partial [Pseudomonadota bacterium]|nr:ABC transporter transmembrane domain-containing protein [Pseudomonadota bacterium]
MNSKDLYFRLLGYVRPHLRIFILSIVATLITAATEPLLPALLKPLLDGSFVEKDPAAIALMPLLLVGVFVVRGVSGFAGAVAMRWVANQVVTDLRGQMFEKILHLPTRRFNDTPGGVLLSKLTYDVNQVMTACTQSLVVLVRDSVAVAGLLGWIFWLNWKLALISFLIAPVIAVAVRVVGKRLRRLSRQMQGSMAQLNHVVDEAI